MRFMLDTNILIDVYSKRKGFFEKSMVLYTEALMRDNMCLVSAKSIMDVHYYLRKLMNKDILRKSIREILESVNLVDLVSNDLINGYHIDGRDYEDDVLTATAKRCRADVIITRNKKDFKKSGIPVMTPEEYLKKNKKDNLRVHETSIETYDVMTP